VLAAQPSSAVAAAEVLIPQLTRAARAVVTVKATDTDGS
jgi:hypothetical protein